MRWRGEIDAKPARRPADALLVCACIALYVAGFISPPPFGWVVVGGLAALAVACRYTQNRAAADLALFLGFVSVGSSFLPLGVSVAGLSAGMVGYAVLLKAFPKLKPLTNWLRRGRLAWSVWLLMAGTAVVSGTALVVWYLVLQPDMSHFDLYPESVPGWLLPIGVLAFSALNAAAEEAVFRGAIMSALASTLRSSVLVIIVQAAAFGVWHYYGFPSGVIGCLMAFSFAVMVGIVRHASRGMLAPWLAHVAADVVILTSLRVVTFDG